MPLNLLTGAHTNGVCQIACRKSKVMIQQVNVNMKCR